MLYFSNGRVKLIETKLIKKLFKIILYRILTKKTTAPRYFIDKDKIGLGDPVSAGLGDGKAMVRQAWVRLN